MLNFIGYSKMMRASPEFDRESSFIVRGPHSAILYNSWEKHLANPWPTMRYSIPHRFLSGCCYPLHSKSIYEGWNLVIDLQVTWSVELNFIVETKIGLVWMLIRKFSGVPFSEFPPRVNDIDTFPAIHLLYLLVTFFMIGVSWREYHKNGKLLNT